MSEFKLVKKEEIKELKATGFLYQHKKTGAQVFYMDNKEKEKVFSIAFHTPPADDTGVAHITEHSVLCGSKKYPVKEPFVELMKGSVNTFLNAMTYTDWTIYPVASKNNKDFRNLTDVYLDAVFFPLMKENPYTLKQEGWHYEYDQSKKELTVNGIVYNEMKGYFSSPDAIGWSALYGHLYPETNYRFESGGLPDAIYKLTQQQFIDFHNKYYHPSNSYTLVSGDLDIEEFLVYLDREYFSKFEKREVPRELQVQKPFKKIKDVEAAYAIGKGEPVVGKSYFYYGVSYETIKDLDLGFSMDILKSILVDFPASPLKRALVDAKLVTDVTASVEDSIYQPNIVFTGIGGDKKNASKFKKVLLETLEHLAKNGFDSKLVDAAINRVEFRLRELDFNKTPRGIVYHVMNLANWINEGDAFKGLFFADRLKKIKAQASKGHFEKIVAEHILKNMHAVFLTLVPQPGLDEKKNEAFRKEMVKRSKLFSAKEISEIISETNTLKELQKKPDSAAALSSIPLLEQSDLDRQNEVVPREEEKIEKVTLLSHPLNTNGISYFRFYFDASAVAQEDIVYLGLFAEILGQISTEKYNYKDLSNVIYSTTGGIGVHTSVISRDLSVEHYRPYVVVSGKVLTENQKNLFELMKEITLHSRFNEKDRWKELVSKIRANLESNLASQGMDYAINRAGSALGGALAYDERLDGVTFFKFISKVDKDFNKRYDDLIKKMKEISQLVFTREGLVVGMAVDKNELGMTKKEIVSFVKNYDDKDKSQTAPVFAAKSLREAIVVGGKVQYVVKAVDAYKQGLKEYRGDLKVLEKILNASYLWNKIRVLGGAYGGFFRIKSDGLLYFGSYRDPNLAESLEVYDHVADYLKDLSLDQRELNKNIIGTIGKFDLPTSPRQQLNLSMMNYLSGVTDSFLQRLREEVFSTSLEGLKSYSAFFENVAKEKNYSVAGGQQKIEMNKKLFDSIIKFWD